MAKDKNIPASSPMSWYQSLNLTMDSLNNSKYFAGITMLLLNLGSKFLAEELSVNQEQLLGNRIIRRFIVFTAVFVATRDVWVSLIITAAFIVIVSNLFNENSSYCVLPKSSKKMFTRVNQNDYQKAKQVIKLYELQLKNN